MAIALRSQIQDLTTLWGRTFPYYIQSDVASCHFLVCSHCHQSAVITTSPFAPLVRSCRLS